MSLNVTIIYIEGLNKKILMYQINMKQEYNLISYTEKFGNIHMVFFSIYNYISIYLYLIKKN